MVIQGYRLSLARKYFLRVSTVLSGGIVFMICRWFPRVELALSFSPCSLADATHVYIENQWQEGSIVPIHVSDFAGDLKEAFPKELSRTNLLILESLRYFEYRYIRFIFNPKQSKFVPNDIWRDHRWNSVDVAMEGIGSPKTIAQRDVLFGKNQIKIEEKPTHRLLLDEVLHPFFLFQIGSMILWSLDNYYYYASCIFIISALSVIATLYETKQNMRKLQKFSQFSCSVRVWRFSSWISVDSAELIPGDVFEITSGVMHVFPADALLLTGDCIVNESMLTGESVPVSKSPITDAELTSLNFEKEDPASISSMSRYFLFSGTKIIRSRSSVATTMNTPNNSNHSFDALLASDVRSGGGLAMVVRTGFNTTKGNLIRSMLFPKPNKFKFYRDSFRFIGVLSIIAGLGFLASFYNFFRLGVSWSSIIVRALDLITIVVPPALPATMAIGTSFAISRLKKGLIFCISPPRVNICGKIDLMCFDKTGTLTQEGLDVLGFRFTVPAFVKTELESIHEDNVSSSTSLKTEPMTCRFSRLYTSTEQVIPKPIAMEDSHTSSDEAIFSTPSSVISGVSLNYSTVPGHPNAESEFAYPLIICAMATCHSVKVVNGELVGDPMDLKMFEFTKWEISESQAVLGPVGNVPLVQPPPPLPGSTQIEPFSQLGLVRTFDFVSGLRRMGVIVKRYRGSNCDSQLTTSDALSDYEAFVKGAPEVIRSICIPESVPSEYDDQLRYYAHHGYRVIAIAHRSLDPMSQIGIRQVKRADIEKNLKFLGFIVFENKLKPGTSAVVKALHQANIRQVMVTGMLLIILNVNRR